jgi:hypothetical protein
MVALMHLILVEMYPQVELYTDQVVAGDLEVMVQEAVVEAAPADMLVEMLTVVALVFLIDYPSRLVRQQVQEEPAVVVMLDKTAVA